MRSHHPSSRTPSSAFTLIELLTVIAIIGILAAILIPTVSKVRETANTATVSSNMRQTSQALLAYVADNRDYLPGSIDATGSVGIIHAVNYMFERNPQGGGGWSDRRCRLGFYLAPYAGIKANVDGPIDIPLFQDKNWEAKMAGGSTIDMSTESSRKWAVVYAVNTVIRRADVPRLRVDPFMPFGNPGTVGGSGGMLNGAAPIRYSVLNQVIPLSRVWWLTQADQDLDLVTNITDNDLNAALFKPLFPDKRITAFFDGSVRPVKVGTNLKGIL